MRKTLMMVLIIYLVAILLSILGCGKVETNDSRQDVVQSGESFTYIVVRLEFIEQMKQLCKESLLEENYTSVQLYNQAIAQCTFEKLTVLSVNPTEITTFINQYCQPSSDVSGLTPEELANISAACAALGVPRT